MPNINPRIRSLDDLLGVARKVENTAAYPVKYRR